MSDWVRRFEQELEQMARPCARDRDYLLKRVHGLYPTLIGKRPSQALLDVITDICDFDVVHCFLGLGQMAVCDFQNQVVMVNRDLERRASSATNLEWMVSSILAHELGHIRLHREEMLERTQVSYYVGIQRTYVDERSYHREREADLYAGVFLVPFSDLRADSQVLLSDEGKRYDGEGRRLSDIEVLARSFHVSPALMESRLVQLGWVKPSTP